MTAEEELFRALRRLERADLSPDDCARLQPAFAALHGAEAIALPVDLIDRIRALDAQMSNTSR